MIVYSDPDKGIESIALDSAHWQDFMELFGERGACGGCWCMSWRLKKADFEANKGAQNKEAMRQLVDHGEPVGVLLYIDGEPVGWCAAAPRGKFIRLNQSRVLKQIDSLPVWSITCLFVAKKHRRQGVSFALIKSAIAWCRLSGATVIEAYPSAPYKLNDPDAFLWTGIPSVFEKAGFRHEPTPSKRKRYMRYFI